MFVPIYNRFYPTKVNSGKIKAFMGWGYPSFTPSFKENHLTHMHKILSQKTRVFMAAYCKDFVILG